MDIDQLHEKLNNGVKGVGGSIGPTEDENMPLQLVCGPEAVHGVVSKFKQSSVLKEEKPTESRHHEQTRGSQQRYPEH